MRTAAKTDSNQPEIVEFLREHWVCVLDLHSVGRGCPDILCLYHGKLVLMEIKSKRGRLTPEQEIFHKIWPVYVVHNRTEAVQALAKALGEK